MTVSEGMRLYQKNAVGVRFFSQLIGFKIGKVTLRKQKVLRHADEKIVVFILKAELNSVKHAKSVSRRRSRLVAGIEYSIAPGLVLGFQFNPLAYRYDVIQICPKGFDKYNASHHNIKIFDMPVLKLGIRF